MNDEIHVVCATDSNYIPYCGVMVTSLFENNKGEKICIHVLGVGLTDENRGRLTQIGRKYIQNILFYDVNTLIACNDNLKKWNDQNNKYWSLAAFSRLFIEDLLPSTIERVIYLDIDIVVCGSLCSLWMDNLEEYLVGWVVDGAPEPNMKRLNLSGYFNTGVLLLNLNLWRKHNIQQQCLEYLNTHWQDLRYADQDVLNPVLQKYSYKILHPKYNVYSYFFLCDVYYKQFIPQEYREKGREAMNVPVILHFISPVKPWHKDCDHPMKNEWLKYLQMTEWKDMEMNYKRTFYERMKLFIRELLKDIPRLLPPIKKAYPHPNDRWYI